MPGSIKAACLKHNGNILAKSAITRTATRNSSEFCKLFILKDTKINCKHGELLFGGLSTKGALVGHWCVTNLGRCWGCNVQELCSENMKTTIFYHVLSFWSFANLAKDFIILSADLLCEILSF